MNKSNAVIKGLLFVTFLAILSYMIETVEWVQSIHLSPLIIAIILGIIVKNVMKLPESFGPGIQFSIKKVLRLAIILLGFRLSFAQVTDIGLKSMMLVTIVTSLTILFSLIIGKKLGLGKGLSTLVGAGSAICGASAIAAVAPVVDAKEKDMTFAIATVTIFGTVSMFLYPLFFQVFHLPDLFYAVWVGSSVHEVAQVVAAGFAAGDQAGQYATLVKLSRVLLVIPFVIVLGVIKVRKNQTKQNKKIVIPWFVFGFLGVVILNSMHIVPATFTNAMVELDNALLTIAMAGLGLETSLEKMKKVGLKPFYLGLLTTIFISLLGFIMTSLFF